MEEEGEDKKVIEQIFCEHDKKGLQTVEEIATVNSNSHLQDFSKAFKNSFDSRVGTETPIWLQQQAKKYQFKGRFLLTLV